VLRIRIFAQVGQSAAAAAARYEEDQPAVRLAASRQQDSVGRFVFGRRNILRK
jgi:hypothetical protein